MIGLLELLVRLHAFFQAGDDHARQREQRDDVGQDDEVVEHIRQLPHEVTAGDSAEEDEHQCDHGIDDAAQPAVPAAKQVVGIDLTEQVPAQDSGEGEEQQADGYDRVAEAGTEDPGEGQLGDVGLGHAFRSPGGQNAVAGRLAPNTEPKAVCARLVLPNVAVISPK